MMMLKNMVAVVLMLVLAGPSAAMAEVVKEYWPDGTIKWERSYNNDVLDGISRGYDEKGTLRTEENYRAGEKHGVSKVYSEKGLLLRESNYNEGVKDGLETTYFRWDSRKTVSLFKDGKKVSEKLYDEKGRLRDEFSFEHSEQGKWKIHQKLDDERGKIIAEY